MQPTSFEFYFKFWLNLSCMKKFRVTFEQKTDYRVNDVTSSASKREEAATKTAVIRKSKNKNGLHKSENHSTVSNYNSVLKHLYILLWHLHIVRSPKFGVL